MADTDILIVGGGPAGLTTAGALKQAGMEAVILDAGERVGQSWEQRYDRLHLHTVRDYSGLAHFPISSSIPKYPSKDQYAGYLRDYAAHFNLRFIANTRVRRVRQVQPAGSRAGWAVETGADTWTARVVVIATGHFGRPSGLELPGRADYGGEVMHSSTYRSGRAFQGKRMLVIGAGNSGLEIAVDLVDQGAEVVAVSIRSGPPVVPRDFLGTPAQLFGIFMHSFPPALSDRIGQALSRLALGDLRRYGMPAASWLPFAARRTPVIDVGFAGALKAGKVSIRPAVRAFSPSGVVYSDQREEVFDGVVLATGYQTGLEELLEPQGLLGPNGSPLFPSGVPTVCAGLYFMGYFDSLRGFLYESNLASRRLAQEIVKRR